MDQSERLQKHVKELLKCCKCPAMNRPAVSGKAVLSKLLLVGQAPGDKEPKLGRPFAWTAGKTLFGWFNQVAGISEEKFRSNIYMAAVCRCFPGKKKEGGDRLPDLNEIDLCSFWLKREIEILKPSLVMPVGKLAISQFLPLEKLDRIIGKKFRITKYGCSFDVIPLPHPSGASPWHRKEPGKTLLKKALKEIVRHRAFREIKWK